MDVAALALATAMHLSSPDFTAGGAIPSALMSRDCGGGNRMPSLAWSGVPSGVRSFALVIRDPDAPIAGGFYHLVFYDIPANVAQLSGKAPRQAHFGLASTGRAAYYGPCPPPGPMHHYIFTLYALDVARLTADSPLDAAALERAIQGHVVAKATLAATASHS